MFFGEYLHSLDNKGRLMIPSKIREHLNTYQTLYVLKGFEGCISIYEEEDFQKLVNSLDDYSYNLETARHYKRSVLASVVDLKIDKLGRIQLPISLLEKYQIGKDVMVIGVGDHFELWDLNSYQKYQESIAGKFEEFAASLDKNER